MSEDSIKPQSMSSGPRNVLRPNDSASLWNCSLSPGWSREESEILRKALIKFGIGNWAKIIESQCLPGKTNAQMNLQLQRMLGQQSTAEFNGLHIDPLVIGEKNSKIQGPTVKRKNNCIVNTGGKPSREEIKRRIQKNKELYELPEEKWSEFELPKPEDPFLVLEAKRSELRHLQHELSSVEEQISALRKQRQLHLQRFPGETDSSENEPEWAVEY
ncbi:9881_t:CDS:2 [Paraglomus occultum]|uniref:9881_t:CDS:1 n=1 Tax=Paraglomus occultum TaxID=144539 RepID=A0A9N8Z9T5_9GLOM|nr:9881_t:CDS:2 [Paraglomus occultum]